MLKPETDPNLWAFDLVNREGRVQDKLAEVLLGIEWVSSEDIFGKSFFKRGK